MFSKKYHALLPFYLGYMKIFFLWWTTPYRHASVSSCCRIFSFKRWVFTKILEVKTANGSFCEVCPLNICILKTSTRQNGVLEYCSPKRGSLEAGSVNNCIWKVSSFEIRFYSISFKFLRKYKKLVFSDSFFLLSFSVELITATPYHANSPLRNRPLWSQPYWHLFLS